MSEIGIAVFTLNQFALDFDGNCERIIESIRLAKQNGAAIRIGPELEVCGYSCEDAFFETDTCFHSWQTVATIMNFGFKDIIIDIGMPVYHSGSLYNCRVVLLNCKILMIRPKTKLANGGNYRESRWFTAWNRDSVANCFPLPSFIARLTSQQYVPFGSEIVLEVMPSASQSCWGDLFRVMPIKIGFEMCEELWVADAVNVSLFGKKGVHIIANGSGSYWEIRKLARALELMRAATSTMGGLYAFSNLIGCDGARICFSGRSLCVLNGEVVAKTTSEGTFLKQIDYVFYKFNPLHVNNYRQQLNIRCNFDSNLCSRLLFDADLALYKSEYSTESSANLSIAIHNFNFFHHNSSVNVPYHVVDILPEQEIMMYGSLWLWDYLRHCYSWCKGFIVPLSGGLDSASVVCMVYCMCSYIYGHLKGENKPDKDFIEALSTILGAPCDSESIKGPKDICQRLLRCVYLKTNYSGEASEERAKRLAEMCGAQFYSIDFTEVYNTVDQLTSKILDRPTPKTIPLRLQNLQARLRMLLTYDLSDCNRLVLAAGNVDEALVGYLTKYDCSSADLNPIGSLSKQDLRQFVAYIRDKVLTEEPEVLTAILSAIPSAELTGENQSDEEDLGLTYEELSLFGRLRRGEFGGCGPYSLFCKLLENSEKYNQPADPNIIAQKVKRFFVLHSRNRHKQTVLTPSLHAETYSPDDNRYDHRQFLFETTWKRQFYAIDERVIIELQNATDQVLKKGD